MTHGRTALVAALLTLVTLLTACSTRTTTVTEVRSDERSGHQYRDVLVVAASRNQEARSIVGDTLTKKLNREGMGATYLAGDGGTLSWDNPAQLRNQLLDIARKGQHDGILVSSLVDARHHERYEPETVSYIPDSRDIGPTASMTYMERSVRPESFERTVEYVIQTTLYDSTSGEAVWQVISSTVDPDSLEKGAADFASVIARALAEPAGKEQGQ